VRRPHDSVSPLPTRQEKYEFVLGLVIIFLISPSPAHQIHKVMPESIYSKTLLKRFQVSLKEKNCDNIPNSTPYNNNNLQKHRENKDVSPIRAISDLRKNGEFVAEKKRDISIGNDDIIV
jgi:hypothetical protein